MGSLADIFIATPATAARYEMSQLLEPHSHAKKYEPHKVRGLTVIDFSYLWAILGDEKWVIRKHMLDQCTGANAGAELENALTKSGALKELSVLLEQITGKEPDWSADEQDSALYRFPLEYVELLAEVAGSDERPVAAKWRSQLKKKSDIDLSETRTRNLLLALAQLAERAKGSRGKKGLYLWTSL